MDRPDRPQTTIDPGRSSVANCEDDLGFRVRSDQLFAKGHTREATDSVAVAKYLVSVWWCQRPPFRSVLGVVCSQPEAAIGRSVVKDVLHVIDTFDSNNLEGLAQSCRDS